MERLQFACNGDLIIPLYEGRFEKNASNNVVVVKELMIICYNYGSGK